MWLIPLCLFTSAIQLISYIIQFFTHLKLCHATATHNFKCLNRSWSLTPKVCMHIRQVFDCEIMWRGLCSIKCKIHGKTQFSQKRLSVGECSEFPANTRRWSNAGLMLAHRLRRWANISPALGQRLVFTGNKYTTVLWELFCSYKDDVTCAGHAN